MEADEERGGVDRVRRHSDEEALLPVRAGGLHSQGVDALLEDLLYADARAIEARVRAAKDLCEGLSVGEGLSIEATGRSVLR